MKATTPILFFVFLFLSTLSFGQTKDNNTQEVPYIEVNGTAQIEIVPDEIYIGIVIKERYVNKVKISIEEQEEKLKTSIKALNIDLANLYLSDANADFVRIRWKKKDLLAKKDYTLKVSNATEVGQVFQKLDELEITDAFISRTNHSKMDSLRKEVRIMAIKAAKEKADYLLNAIGQETGKPLIVKESDVRNISSIRAEGEGTNTNSSRSYEREYYVVDNQTEDNNEIQFQKIKLQTGVYVKFSIK